MPVTPNQQRIYNAYQAAVGHGSGKPFRYRKNFDKFDTDPQYPFLLKLELFFQNHSNVDAKMFFEAPYKLHDDEHMRHELKFYTTQRAIAAYSVYVKKVDRLDPDSDTINEQTRDAYSWMLKFCRENGLKLNEYIKHQTGVQNSFVLHLQERKINVYSLLEFDDVAKVIASLDADVIEFMGCGNLLKLDEFRSRYLASKQLKSASRKFKKVVETQLQS